MPLSLRSVDVSIECNGEELTPYGADIEGEALVSAYVASQVDQTLEVADPDLEDVPFELDIANLGLIQIKILRVVDTRQKRISERSKKAGSHRIGLGEEVESSPSRTQSTSKKLDSVDEPWVAFNFRYLPEDMLRAKGIIPLKPSHPTATASIAYSP
ncbi:hypothetical protein BV25DRAFT_1834700 [Artomyces pyxidatus]|uniref:Uncharacterized protein n=1 Tax=Artomyces pyxidatus TaxID=48021 RepID=A0ACB8TGX1_9AGAM|nr:hypothetical protein BV25DRAFT_1834700 [Artomyces pyxidatus]